ncbi:Gfo/Idh/MocA family protein [Paenibacillus sp. SYP-B4298]|uniref:Gfo/Idh/MocA family protein n=1 Tax=Paenibacillus sp. SYP-B4298 TaxID=2996034 RepID=UPI0022DD1597|nr:Gfo/Idh/MocA family oxidoreductase [Paenibacillus sp. SYP-B4298]
MNHVRIGIIGIGSMGSAHARELMAGKVAHAELTAVCDVRPERLEWAQQHLGQHIARFDQPGELLRSGTVDAVLIATPHYDHPTLSIEALQQGLHTLIEKPAGVYTKAVAEMNAVALQSGKVFAIMYNQRTNPLYRKLKDLIDSGELGELKRSIWIITNWYRPQSYYDSGSWRATWAGEGGGVLLNQDPHQLDLWQWMCGMPKRVRAFMSFGKYRNIEVEDDVTAYVEYDNGATGLFVTTTGEAPGTNRLEVTGDRGKIVIEDNKLTFWRLRVPESQFNREFKGGFGSPECWKCDIPAYGDNSQHLGIMRNWVEAIRNGTELIAPGIEGIHGLTLSNAMHLSAWTDDWAELPLDEELFYTKLQDRIAASTFRKEAANIALDVTGTH